MLRMPRTTKNVTTERAEAKEAPSMDAVLSELQLLRQEVAFLREQVLKPKKGAKAKKPHSESRAQKIRDYIRSNKGRYIPIIEIRDVIPEIGTSDVVNATRNDKKIKAVTRGVYIYRG